MEKDEELEGEAEARGNFEDFDEDGLEYDDEYSVYRTGEPRAGSYFQAEPLTRKQRQFLLKQIPLMVGKTANFNIGKLLRASLQVPASLTSITFRGL